MCALRRTIRWPFRRRVKYDDQVTAKIKKRCVSLFVIDRIINRDSAIHSRTPDRLDARYCSITLANRSDPNVNPINIIIHFVTYTKQITCKSWKQSKLSTIDALWCCPLIDPSAPKHIYTYEMIMSLSLTCQHNVRYLSAWSRWRRNTETHEELHHFLYLYKI